jgi:hypothetical protein
VPAEPSFVIESASDFAADALFNASRDQVIIAVRVTPVFGRLDLTVVAHVVDEANLRGFTLVREQPFHEEWLICVFDAYDEDEE